MLTISGDWGSFKQAIAILVLECWDLARGELGGELRCSVSRIVHVSSGFVQSKTTDGSRRFDLTRSMRSRVSPGYVSKRTRRPFPCCPDPT